MYLAYQKNGCRRLLKNHSISIPIFLKNIGLIYLWQNTCTFKTLKNDVICNYVIQKWFLNQYWPSDCRILITHNFNLYRLYRSLRRRNTRYKNPQLVAQHCFVASFCRCFPFFTLCDQLVAQQKHLLRVEESCCEK